MSVLPLSWTLPPEGTQDQIELRVPCNSALQQTSNKTHSEFHGDELRVPCDSALQQTSNKTHSEFHPNELRVPCDSALQQSSNKT